jgi:predicted MPP superfamily phosphohydrolase
MARGKHYTLRRQYADKAEGIIFRGGWAASLAYRLGFQGRLSVDRHSFDIPEARLTAPLRLAFASDLHAGPLTDPRIFETLAETINTFSPHVVLLGGDYVTGHHRHVNTLRSLLQAIKPTFGVLAVFGNHDLWVDHEHIQSVLTDAGARMLVNEECRLGTPFENVSIFGLDDPGTGEPDASTMIPRAGRLQILLMHSPIGIRHMRPGAFNVAYCGHTHGGQIALPTGIPIILPHGAGPRAHAHGRINLNGNGQLLVSRGIGMSSLPVRIFAPSEVHLCTFSAAA